MARLSLTIYGVSCYKDETATAVSGNDLSISTEKDTATANLEVGNKRLTYILSLVDFSFKKQMYQPTEIIARVQLSLNEGVTYQALDKKTLISLFLCKKVSLKEINTGQDLGSDFYVDEVHPSFKPTSMYVTLKIYSVDKLLTLKHYSRSYVRKKLVGDILKGGELKMTEGSDNKKTCKYPLPFDTTNTIELNADKAKQLFYDGGKKEHIFPYLVQYNESFYDFLARTTNRWGEFLYYENGKLNIGYDDTKVETISGFADITYVDLDNETQDIPADEKFDFAGTEEADFLDSTLRKSPNSVSGTLFWPTVKKWDKVLMKEITAFFKNDKNIPTWLGNRLFANTWDAAVKGMDVIKANNDFNSTYFPDKDKPGLPEQYGEYYFGKDKKSDKDDGFNPFSEINSTYDKGLYQSIVKNEYLAAKGAVCIDYNVTCPNLKLGSVIEYNKEKFIVVEISSHIKEDLEYKWNKATQSVNKETTRALVFQVIATPYNILEKRFYPTVIPAGHVRLADPQVATITDADDPDGKGRVRVMFGDWQTIGYEDEKKKEGITEATKAISSPWLTFAASSSGSPTIGKHYEGNKVLVGFVDGNIERPYVMAGLASKGGSADYIQTTPGGHQLLIQDDEDGLKNFLTGMFMPCVGTLGPFLTAIPALNKIAEAICKPAKGSDNNLSLGGGFELSDKFGIYKISGSTDGREVSIASPWGDVNINAFTGINIEAPNGDISIKGKNVKIEAGNNLELISGTNYKNKIMGGSKAGFGTDVRVAVAKKLADKVSQIIDLSTVRATIEIIFRPAEGALRIKSNRFLMLEGGKGKCFYPKSAYANEADYNKEFEETKKNDFRKGLKLASGVEQLLAQIPTIVKGYSDSYKNAYNKCVDNKAAFEALLNKPRYYKMLKGYINTKPETKKICNNYSVQAFQDKLWDDGENLLAENDLGFVDGFSLKEADVTLTNMKDYSNGRHLSQKKATEGVLARRKEAREKIIKAANELRQAIIDFKKIKEITAEDVTAKCATILDNNLPKDAKKKLIDAFDKTKLGDDVFYYKALTAEQKNFGIKYTDAAIKPHLVALERKVATLAIEGLGFEDGWRAKKPNPDYGVDGKATKDIKAFDVPKKFAAAEIVDDQYWEDYVNSIVAVPPMNALESKALEEFKKKAKENLKALKFWESWQENDSYNLKKGGIMFSSDCNVFNLNKNIESVPSPYREKLTMDDNNNDDVRTMLDKVKSKLNALK